ncbi:MAG: Na+/H+ antiporter NhaC family protein [Spirochaetaceae bacterium]
MSDEKKDFQTEPQIDEITRLDFHLGGFGSAIPILLFIIWAVVTSLAEVVTTNGLSVGAVVALVVGMALCKQDGHTYAKAVIEGFTRTIGAVAIIAWFFAGMFSEVLQAGGLVEGLIWIASTVGAEGAIFTAVTFLLAAIFASAVGTGYGTAVAFGTLMYPAGVAVGAHPLVCAGAILSGAAFGDKLAPISDTTIVSAATQDTDVPGCVAFRFKYVLIAALPVVVLYLLFGGAAAAEAGEGAAIIEEYAEPAGLVLLIPFAAVLIIAFRGYHLLVSLTWGIILGILINLIFGLAPMKDILYLDTAESTISGALVDGVAGYVEYAVLILLIVALGHLLRLSGAMNQMVEWSMSKIKRAVWKAEVAIWALVSALNLVITINTAAEVAAAPYVRSIGRKYGLHPYRRALLLDGPSSSLGYVLPWSGGLLLLVTTIGGVSEEYDFVQAVTATQLTPFVWFGFVLLAVLLIVSITGWNRKFEGPEGPEGKPVDKPYKGILAESDEEQK